MPIYCDTIISDGSDNLVGLSEILTNLPDGEIVEVSQWAAGDNAEKITLTKSGTTAVGSSANSPFVGCEFSNNIPSLTFDSRYAGLIFQTSEDLAIWAVESPSSLTDNGDGTHTGVFAPSTSGQKFFRLIYGVSTSVQDIVGLAAVDSTALADKAKIFVAQEQSVYALDRNALAGQAAANGGSGFWKRQQNEKLSPSQFSPFSEKKISDLRLNPNLAHLWVGADFDGAILPDRAGSVDLALGGTGTPVVTEGALAFDGASYVSTAVDNLDVDYDGEFSIYLIARRTTAASNNPVFGIASASQSNRQIAFHDTNETVGPIFIRNNGSGGFTRFSGSDLWPTEGEAFGTAFQFSQTAVRWHQTGRVEELATNVSQISTFYNFALGASVDSTPFFGEAEIIAVALVKGGQTEAEMEAFRLGFVEQFSEREPIDVFYNWGQSNATPRNNAGAYGGDVTFENQILIGDDAIREGAIEASATSYPINSNAETPAFGYAAPFALKMAETTGRKQCVLTIAKGGSNIESWLEGGANHARIENYVRHSLDQLWAMGYAPRVRGLITMQGESNGGTVDYNLLLAQVVGHFRALIGTAELPVVICNTNWTEPRGAGSYELAVAQDEFIRNDLNSVTVSTEGVQKNTDTASVNFDAGDPHFSPAGVIELGGRLATAFLTGSGLSEPTN